MLHLLRKKKRASKEHHHPIDYLAEINAVFNGIALYPQVINALRTHDIQALSLASFLVLFITNIIWTIYGIHRKDIAVIVCSALIVVSSGTLTTLILLWR